MRTVVGCKNKDGTYACPECSRCKEPIELLWHWHITGSIVFCKSCYNEFEPLANDFLESFIEGTLFRLC